MTKYLLTCGCGKTLPVEIGQAGGKVACTCGAQLDVPTLRNLRLLPVVVTEKERSGAAWSTRNGLITVGLLLAALFAGITLWSRLTEPAVPKFESDSFQSAVKQHVDTMTPVDGWQHWVEHYRPLANKGFNVIVDSRAPAIEQAIVGKRFFQKMMLILAAIFGAVALAAAFWPHHAKRV